MLETPAPPPPAMCHLHVRCLVAILAQAAAQATNWLLCLGNPLLLALAMAHHLFVRIVTTEEWEGVEQGTRTMIGETSPKKENKLSLRTGSMAVLRWHGRAERDSAIPITDETHAMVTLTYDIAVRDKMVEVGMLEEVRGAFYDGAS